MRIRRPGSTLCRTCPSTLTSTTSVVRLATSTAMGAVSVRTGGPAHRPPNIAGRQTSSNVGQFDQVAGQARRDVLEGQVFDLGGELAQEPGC